MHAHLEASTPTSTNWVRPGIYSADRNPTASAVVGSTRRSKVGLPEVVSTLTGAVKWRTTCTSRDEKKVVVEHCSFLRQHCPSVDLHILTAEVRGASNDEATEERVAVISVNTPCLPVAVVKLESRRPPDPRCAAR